MMWFCDSVWRGCHHLLVMLVLKFASSSKRLDQGQTVHLATEAPHGSDVKVYGCAGIVSCVWTEHIKLRSGNTTEFSLSSCLHKTDFLFKFSEYSISSIQTGFPQVFDTSDSSSGPTPIKPGRCWDCWDLYDMLITASAPCQIAHLSMDNLAMASTCDCRWSINLPKKSMMSNCQNHISFSLEPNMGRPCSTELWTIGSCQVTSSSVAGRDTWNYEMLRRRLQPAIRLCSPCPCLRIQASKSAYGRCEPWPSHRDLSDPGTHQSCTDNRKQPPLPFLWGNHSFFMPASQTSKLTCFAQAMLGHKISGPSSSQHLPWTNPQCCKCPCNLQVTKKHCRMTLSIRLGSHRSQSLRKLDVIHVLSGFQDACVGQLLWIESGCCSDLTGKKTSPTRFFQRNTKHMGFLNTKSWIFFQLQANWGLRPSTRSLWNTNLHVKNCEATMRRTKNLRANIGTSWQVPAESEYDWTLSI